MAARVVNATVGFWLWVSAFAWPHSRAQLFNSWIAGMLIVTFALMALEAAPRARYLNAALGVWLIASSIFLPGTNTATMVNHLVVGVVLTTLALVRGGRRSLPAEG